MQFDNPSRTKSTGESLLYTFKDYEYVLTDNYMES